MRFRYISDLTENTRGKYFVRGLGGSIDLTKPIRRTDRMSALAALRDDTTRIGHDMTVVVEREREKLKVNA